MPLFGFNPVTMFNGKQENTRFSENKNLWRAAGGPASMKNKQLNVAIFYDEQACYTASTITEHIVSFARYSQHNIRYARGTRNAVCPYSVHYFDVIILHYSVRLCIDGLISPFLIKILSEFNGLKVLFIQDEYDKTEFTRRWMEKLQFDIVFTCVPEQHIQDIYPKERFKATKFVQNLTGYVSDSFLDNKLFFPFEERTNYVCYRGRNLPYWYGELGRNKYEIGVKMKEYCKAWGIPCDIESEDTERIYGDAWYYFLANSRATLGTESGANIFDFDGKLRLNILREIEKNPDYSYAKAKKQYLKNDGLIKMGQISPKMFEAILVKTVLILFEGNYSNILLPDKHYIPLKKDWSNVKEVLEKIKDINYLEKISELAYQDIIAEGKYSYKSFVKFVEETIMGYLNER